MKKLLFLGALLATITLTGCRSEQPPSAEEIQMAAEQRAIEEAYLWLHFILGAPIDPGGITYHHFPLSSNSEEWLERASAFLPFERIQGAVYGHRPNAYGIYTHIYMDLLLFFHETGIHLSYEKLVAYFDYEFEPDGTRRLYNNGHHPEIEAYANWRRNLRRASRWSRSINAYFSAFRRIMDNYFVERGGERGSARIFEQSPQVLDALARAYADPDYVLDLTSLLEVGY